MSLAPSLAAERPATLQAAAESETPYGGRTDAWTDVAVVWVALKLETVRVVTSAEGPPARAQGATAVARDHPLAAPGQRLALDGETPFAVREVRRGEPAPGRMTLVLDRLL